jgi:hypothetical protein
LVSDLYFLVLDEGVFFQDGPQFGNTLWGALGFFDCVKFNNSNELHMCFRLVGYSTEGGSSFADRPYVQGSQVQSPGLESTVIGQLKETLEVYMNSETGKRFPIKKRLEKVSTFKIKK